jgi:hypothetical protein
VAPVFLEDRYRRDLPGRFWELGEFHGVTHLCPRHRENQVIGMLTSSDAP